MCTDYRYFLTNLYNDHRSVVSTNIDSSILNYYIIYENNSGHLVFGHTKTKCDIFSFNIQ